MKNKNNTYALTAGLIYGLVIAIRPSDFFIALIPILWGVTNKETLLNKLQLVLKNKEQIILAGLIAFACFLPQLLYYRVYAGEYFLNIYNDPSSTVDLSNPRFAYVLFGFRKGWFIYSPLSLLGFIGLIVCYKRCREFLIPTVLFLVIVIYLIASFTSLVSYGYRAFIQSYALLVLPTGALVEYISRKKLALRIPVYLIITLLTLLNMHQAYQIYAGVIDGRRMTKEYYFRVIGKNHRSFEDEKYLLVNRSETSKDSIPESGNYFQKELLSLDFENTKNNSDTKAIIAHTGNGALKMSSEVPYGPDIKLRYDELTNADYCFIRSEVYVFADTDISNDFFIVITTMNDKKEHIKYRTAEFKPDANKFIPGQWNKLVLEYITPEPIRGDEIIQTFAWNRGNQTLWIDDFKSVAFIEK